MSRNDSQSVNQIKENAKKICNSSQLKDSIFELAQCYFEERLILEEKVRELSASTTEQDSSSTHPAKPQRLLDAESALDEFDSDMNSDRLSRLTTITQYLDVIIDACQDDDGGVAYKKIAKQLSILFLSSEPEHIHYTKINTRNKPLYRALLSLLLLDKLLQDDDIEHPYIKEYYKGVSSIFEPRFKNNVLLPIMLVSMCSDVGHKHPKLSSFLHGENEELDPNRLLSSQDRNFLLKQNYKHVTQFLVSGLGIQKYVGNSKDERETFEKAQKHKLLFIKTLLKSMLQPKDGIGNLIKIPQVYTSVILNTKPTISTNNIPRVFQLLHKHADNGMLNGAMIEKLRIVTGDFPMGYGVAYIPRDSERSALNQYEYAIVSQLYPNKPDMPTCRSTTRNMTFHSSNLELRLSCDYNLYFPAARKKLETISKKRLNEILQKLWSNFENRPDMAQIIPTCWQPYEYFCNPKYQNLWNNVDCINN